MINSKFRSGGKAVKILRGSHKKSFQAPKGQGSLSSMRGENLNLSFNGFFVEHDNQK